MANPYSKYTGSKISPVPAGYLAAAAKSAEGMRKSGEKFGDMIGAGIAKYYEGKQEARGEEAHDWYRENRGYSTEAPRGEEPSVAELPSAAEDTTSLSPLTDSLRDQVRELGDVKQGLVDEARRLQQSGGLIAGTEAFLLPEPGWEENYDRWLDADAKYREAQAALSAIDTSDAPAPAPAYLPQGQEAGEASRPAERYIPTLNERLEAGEAALLGMLDEYGDRISSKKKKEIYEDHERWIGRTTDQHNADRLHKLRVATEARLGTPTAPTAIQEQTLLKMKHDLKQAKNAAPPPGESARKMAEYKLGIAKMEADLAKAEESLLTPEQKAALKEKAAADLARVQASTKKIDNENILLGNDIEQIGVDATVQKRVGTATDIIDMPGYKFVWTSKYGGQVEDADGAVKGELTPAEERGVRDSITRNTTQLTNLFRTLTVINVGEGKVVVDYTKMSDAEAAIANQYQAQIIALKKMLPRFEGSNLLRATELIDFQATKKSGGTEAVYWLPDGASALPDTSGGASTGPAAGQKAIDDAKKRAEEKIKKAAGGDN